MPGGVRISGPENQTKSYECGRIGQNALPIFRAGEPVQLHGRDLVMAVPTQRRTGPLTLCASAAVLSAVVGCTVDDTADALSATPGAAIVATVDCGDDGVATVHSSFESRESQEVFVSRAPDFTSDTAVPFYSERFRVDGEAEESEVTIWTTPSRGVCTVKLVDEETGRVMVRSTGPAPDTVTGLARPSS